MWYNLNLIPFSWKWSQNIPRWKILWWTQTDLLRPEPYEIFKLDSWGINLSWLCLHISVCTAYVSGQNNRPEFRLMHSQPQLLHELPGPWPHSNSPKFWGPPRIPPECFWRHQTGRCDHRLVFTVRWVMSHPSPLHWPLAAQAGHWAPGTRTWPRYSAHVRPHTRTLSHRAGSGETRTDRSSTSWGSTAPTCPRVVRPLVKWFTYVWNACWYDVFSILLLMLPKSS